MAAGTRVGEVARDLYPEGVLIDESTLSQALSSTATQAQTIGLGVLVGPPGVEPGTNGL